MARRKNVKIIDPRYFLNETVNRNDDGSALEEKRIGSMLDPKTYEHPDPEDPNWPWKPGDSVEGNRPHPYEAEPVMGSIKRRPGESREEYDRRIRKGKHRAQYRLPDEGELDPYELEESWADDDAGGWQRQYQRDQGYRVKGPVVPSSTTEDERKKRAADRRRRNREEDLEEGCPHAADGEDDPDADGARQERSHLNEAEGETPEDVAQRISNMPAMFRHSIINDIRYMAEGSKEMIGYYPHVENHVEFAQAVLQLMGEG
jgi:hypothetical protein